MATIKLQNLLMPYVTQQTFSRQGTYVLVVVLKIRKIKAFYRIPTAKRMGESLY